MLWKLYPQKETRYHGIRGRVGPTATLDVLEKRKTLAPAEFKPCTTMVMA
jgi:hypothetical protein